VSNRPLSSAKPSNRARIRRRAGRRGLEIGHDLAAWICGLLVAGWAIRDISRLTVTMDAVARALPATCVLAVSCGLAAGLYRGRHQRGSFDEVLAVAARTGATVLVIAIARPSGSVIAELTAAAERCGLVPKIIPSISELLSGSARIEGVRDPRISDLLGRSPVQTDLAAVAGHFAGKRVLITGAGGSIGSELCRQLHQFRPAKLIMLDRDESALHAIQLDLHGRALLDSDNTVLADIRDPRRIRQVFEQHRPEIVFHAAALKHLPLLERYPAEALKTNVGDADRPGSGRGLRSRFLREHLHG
jgi:hypothetical protein